MSADREAVKATRVLAQVLHGALTGPVYGPVWDHLSDAYTVEDMVAALLSAVPHGPGPRRVVIEERPEGAVVLGLIRLVHHDWRTHVSDGEGGTMRQTWATFTLDPPEVVSPPCECWTCQTEAADDPLLIGMVVCEFCGNKRCPHATHHDNACSASNEPNQPGSRYRLTDPPAPPLRDEGE